jgi:hypothetical protein
MAVQTQYGKLSGTVEEPLLPVTVWEDAGADLAADVAIEAAQDAAPSSYFSWPQYGVPSFEQLSNSAWVVNISYRPRVPSTPAAPPVGEINVDYRMSFQAQPKYMYDAIECLGVYDTDGLVSGLSRLKVNIQHVGGSNSVIGMQVDPLPEVHSLDVILPGATLTAAYRKDLESLQYRFNDSGFMGYGMGELQLVRFEVQKRTNEDWRLSFGFGAGTTRTNVTFDGNTTTSDFAIITVDEIPPYAIAWTYDRDVHIDFTEKIEKLADLVVVQRVWEFGDFTKLGLGAL